MTIPSLGAPMNLPLVVEVVLAAVLVIVLGLWTLLSRGGSGAPPYLHWQNLNEREQGRGERAWTEPLLTGWPHHGRAWLHLADQVTLTFSWHLWSSFCACRFTRDTSGLKFHWSIPPVALWFGVEWQRLACAYDGDREIGLSVYDWTINWSGWHTPNSWSPSTTPWYRYGYFNIKDTLLGRPDYSQRVLEVRDVDVAMPERAYRANVKLTEDTWKRPRWPIPLHVTRAHIDMLPGEQIPIPGKGENSWDCGDDATHGLTTPARTIEEAIGNLIGSRMETRRKRGGEGWTP